MVIVITLISRLSINPETTAITRAVSLTEWHCDLYAACYKSIPGDRLLVATKVTRASGSQPGPCPRSPRRGSLPSRWRPSAVGGPMWGGGRATQGKATHAGRGSGARSDVTHARTPPPSVAALTSPALGPTRPGPGAPSGQRPGPGAHGLMSLCRPPAVLHLEHAWPCLLRVAVLVARVLIARIIRLAVLAILLALVLPGGIAVQVVHTGEAGPDLFPRKGK